MGRLQRRIKITSIKELVNMTGYPKGVYFLLIRNNEIEEKIKILKL